VYYCIIVFITLEEKVVDMMLRSYWKTLGTSFVTYNCIRGNMTSECVGARKFHTITSAINIPERSKKNGGEDACFAMPHDWAVFDGICSFCS
jgi:hypothetical protein